MDVLKTSTYVMALLALTITGCSIKAYKGATLPDNQVATVALKSPTAAYVPLLWIFPLNMLTWFADDWRETAWTDDITIDTNNLDMADRETRIAEDWFPRYWEGQVLEGKVELDRFKTVKLKPGRYQINTITKSMFGTTIPTTLFKKSIFICESPPCEDIYYEAKYDECQLNAALEAGQHYEIFLRKHKLTLLNVARKLETTAQCIRY